MTKAKKTVTIGFVPLPPPLKGWMREWKNPLRLANIFLATILCGLVAISVILYLSPVSLDITPPKRGKKMAETKINPPQLLDRDESGYQFVRVSEENVFSPQRQDWVPIAPSEKGPNEKNPEGQKTGSRKDPIANQQAPRFTLQGIVIVNNDIKRALINKGAQKAGAGKEAATVYVKEGDDLDGFKVKKIEDSEVMLESEGSEVSLRVFKEPAPLSPEMIMPSPAPVQPIVQPAAPTPPTPPGIKGKGHGAPQRKEGQTEQTEQGSEQPGSEAAPEEAPSGGDEELDKLEEALDAAQSDEEAEAVIGKAVESMGKRKSRKP